MTNGVRHMAGRGEVNSNHVWTDAVDSQLCIWTGFSDQSDDLNIKSCLKAMFSCLQGVFFASWKAPSGEMFTCRHQSQVAVQKHR